ncbi:serine/threonine protein kinase [Gordonia sp. VNK21]|uniref:serine/threonine protein kinase n=1 Tax=Gordonia sp. VNK21 TaxID=3382483 RepID=UPI0038D412F0
MSHTPDRRDDAAESGPAELSTPAAAEPESTTDAETAGAQTEAAEEQTETAVAQKETAETESGPVGAEKKKKKKRKRDEAARLEQARQEAVAQAEADRLRREKERSPVSRLREYLNPRRHPVVVTMTALCVTALVAMSVLAWLFTDRDTRLSDLQRLDRDKAAAEKVAGDYAAAAATLSYQDLPGWAETLKRGTASELSSRFDTAVKTVTPLFQEVQWSQTGTLIAATTVDVRADRQFVVQVFVDTKLTSTQNPSGLNIITPYTITLDRDENWLITDVADIAGVAQDGSIGAGVPDLTGTGGQGDRSGGQGTEQPAPTP